MIRGMSDQPGKILLELVIDTCHQNKDLESVVHAYATDSPLSTLRISLSAYITLPP